MQQASPCKQYRGSVLREGGQRTRHLRVRAAFIRDMQQRKEIEVSHCPGDIQLADSLTKALMTSRLDDLCLLFGLGPPATKGEVAQASVQALMSSAVRHPSRFPQLMDFMDLLDFLPQIPYLRLLLRLSRPDPPSRILVWSERQSLRRMNQKILVNCFCSSWLARVHAGRICA